LNVPWIAVPFERISETFPDCTCRMKNGLNGTWTRGCAFVAREAIQ
jgi:hypothetical protein